MSRLALNATLALAAFVSYLAMVNATGLIPENNGLGFDGTDYARMLERSYDAGTPNTRLRPLVVGLAQLVMYSAGDVVSTFRWLNGLFAAALALVVCLLADAYGAPAWAKTYLVATLATCVATARMPVFYPVLVDLGAYVFIVAAVWAALGNRWWLTSLLTVLAAMSREFGIMAAVFGVHRQLRTHVSPWRVVVTFLPAFIAVAIIRWLAMPGSGAPLGAADLLKNLRYWRDPLYVALFLYFGATVFGGVSLIVGARAHEWVGRMWREPEWLTYSVPIVAITALGSADLWRYFAFLLPTAVVLFVQTSKQWSTRRALVLGTLAAVGTWFTQQPFVRLSLPVYFRDWFPYYGVLGNRPTGDVTLWPVWGWRFVVSAVLLVLLSPWATLLVSAVKEARSTVRTRHP